MKRYFYSLRFDEADLPCLVKEERSYNCEKGKRYDSPEAVYELCNGIGLTKMCEEYIYLICMDAKCHLIGFFEVSHGGADYSLCKPREVYQKALMVGSVNIILVHNHPSGETYPSQSDLDLTKRLKEAGKLLGIPLFDHVIVGKEEFYSMSQQNDL